MPVHTDGAQAQHSAQQHTATSSSETETGAVPVFLEAARWASPCWLGLGEANRCRSQSRSSLLELGLGTGACTALLILIVKTA